MPLLLKQMTQKTLFEPPKTERVEKKLKSEEGEIKLNGVVIKYKFTACDGTTPSHLEFDSDKIPNLISETGYRSQFFDFDLNCHYDNVWEIIADYLDDDLGIKEKPVFIKDGKEVMLELEVIDKEFIMRDDLRDWIFKNDGYGKRYRERIIEKIEEVGIENWFKLKGYPTAEDSVWKNRYTGTLLTLGEDIHRFDNDTRKSSLQEQGYYLWENNLPLEFWNDKNMNPAYVEGTKEYFEKKKEEEKVKEYERKKREKKKPSQIRGERSIMNLKFELEQTQEELKNKPNDFFLSEKIKSLTSEIYERRKPYVEYLTKWRDFIVNLVKEKGEEINLIWFDDSSPMDCEICVKLKGHRCHHSCVDFRFEKGRLHAYDSHFGGGTTFLNPGFHHQDKSEEEIEKWEKEKIIEVMEKVFAKKCSNSSWENGNTTRREMILDENGWELGFEDIEDSSQITPDTDEEEEIDEDDEVADEDEAEETENDNESPFPCAKKLDKTGELMEKTMDKLKDECWAIKGYFEEFLNPRKNGTIMNGRIKTSNSYYADKLKEMKIETSDLNKLKELYDSKANAYHLYYCKVYEMRWGKPADEEYSHV